MELVDEVPQADGDAHGDKQDAHEVEEWMGISPIAFLPMCLEVKGPLVVRGQHLKYVQGSSNMLAAGRLPG